MYHKTIIHRIPSGQTVKFTVRERIIDGEIYYYANVVDVELEAYKKLSDTDKETYYGMEITNGRQQVINRKNVDTLIADILSKYGRAWLETDK